MKYSRFNENEDTEKEELLELYKRYSTANGVVPGADSRDENGGGSDGDN